MGSFYGSETVEIGRSKPEVVAAKTLERIVRADLKRRAQEQARWERQQEKLRKPRQTKGDAENLKR